MVMYIKKSEKTLEVNHLENIRDIINKSELSISEDFLLFLTNQSMVNDRRFESKIHEKQTQELKKWEENFKYEYRCFLTALVVNNEESIKLLHGYLQKNGLSDLSYFSILSTIIKETDDLYLDLRRFIENSSYNEFVLALKEIEKSTYRSSPLITDINQNDIFSIIDIPDNFSLSIEFENDKIKLKNFFSKLSIDLLKNKLELQDIILTLLIQITSNDKFIREFQDEILSVPVINREELKNCLSNLLMLKTGSMEFIVSLLTTALTVEFNRKNIVNCFKDDSLETRENLKEFLIGLIEKELRKECSIKKLMLDVWGYVESKSYSKYLLLYVLETIFRNEKSFCIFLNTLSTEAKNNTFFSILECIIQRKKKIDETTRTLIEQPTKNDFLKIINKIVQEENNPCIGDIKKILLISRYCLSNYFNKEAVLMFSYLKETTSILENDNLYTLNLIVNKTDHLLEDIYDELFKKSSNINTILGVNIETPRKITKSAFELINNPYNPFGNRLLYFRLKKLICLYEFYCELSNEKNIVLSYLKDFKKVLTESSLSDSFLTNKINIIDYITSELSITQTDLAGLLSVSPPAINQYKNKKAKISPENLQILKFILGCTELFMHGETTIPTYGDSSYNIENAFHPAIASAYAEIIVERVNQALNDKKRIAEEEITRRRIPLHDKYKSELSRKSIEIVNQLRKYRLKLDREYSKIEKLKINVALLKKNYEDGYSEKERKSEIEKKRLEYEKNHRKLNGIEEKYNTDHNNYIGKLNAVISLLEP